MQHGNEKVQTQLLWNYISMRHWVTLIFVLWMEIVCCTVLFL